MTAPRRNQLRISGNAASTAFTRATTRCYTAGQIFFRRIMDPLSNVEALLRTDFDAEANSGFARLARIPCTSIVKLLDYFESIEAHERDHLLDVLARIAAMKFFPPERVSGEFESLKSGNPAFAKCWSTIRSEQFSAGFRHQGIKMAKMILSDAGSRAEMANYRDKLAWQPRDDPPESLVPRHALASVQPAGAPLLRNLTSAALKNSFATGTNRVPGGETEYTGEIGESEVSVKIEFGSGAAQLHYGVLVLNPRADLTVQRLSYEDLWFSNPGWDYLTEENAQRSIELLGEQIRYLVNLSERLVA
jgi:hypothetical protein